MIGYGLTSITKRVPRTPRIAVGVLTFIAPGELRAISPDIIENRAAVHIGEHRAFEITRIELVVIEHDLTVGAARHHGVVDKGDSDRAVGAGLDGVLFIERVADFGGGARSIAHDLGLSGYGLYLCDLGVGRSRGRA
ncbi:MAG: hypothetical protein ACREQH_07220 [Candidatus Binatus sp.]